MDEQRIHDLLSGRRKGAAASIQRAALTPAGWCYATVARVRNTLFDRGFRKIHHGKLRVISVGNLTTGGTGKTPMVALLVSILQEAGQTPAILSRGYRSGAAGDNDEKRVLEWLCPGVLHVQNPDRVSGMKQIRDFHPDVSVVVLDDGFQHRRLHRDLNILLIDATNPFGYDHLLPRGLLREPLSGLRRADLILITRIDLVTSGSLKTTLTRIQQTTTSRDTEPLLVSFRPRHLVNAARKTLPVEHISDRRIVAACGIGNPSSFFELLDDLGAHVVEHRVFPDHYHFTSADVAALLETVRATNADFLIVTLKDLVKFPPLDDRQDSVCALMIEPQLGDEQLSRLKDVTLSTVRNPAAP